MTKRNLFRYSSFVLGVLLVAIAYNVFILPSNIVYGVSGLGVIFKKIMNLDPAFTIMVSSILLLILSCSLKTLLQRRRVQWNLPWSQNHRNGRLR